MAAVYARIVGVVALLIGLTVLAVNLEAWRGLMEDFNLTKNNQAVLADCHEVAAKMKKQQHCTIVVPAP